VAAHSLAESTFEVAHWRTHLPVVHLVCYEEVKIILATDLCM
jgi:hypothetical protein